jgi:hypothetical protein
MQVKSNNNSQTSIAGIWKIKIVRAMPIVLMLFISQSQFRPPLKNRRSGFENHLKLWLIQLNEENGETLRNNGGFKEK